jgi:hypothetical protein
MIIIPVHYSWSSFLIIILDYHPIIIFGNNFLSSFLPIIPAQHSRSSFLIICPWSLFLIIIFDHRSWSSLLINILIIIPDPITLIIFPEYSLWLSFLVIYPVYNSFSSFLIHPYCHSLLMHFSIPGADWRHQLLLLEKVSEFPLTVTSTNTRCLESIPGNNT